VSDTRIDETDHQAALESRRKMIAAEIVGQDFSKANIAMKWKLLVLPHQT